MKLPLRFDDGEAACELAAADPPEDVLVHPPVERIERGAPPRTVTEVVIEWEPRTPTRALARWMVWAVRRRNRDMTRVNEQDIVLTEDTVQRFTESQLASVHG